MLGIVVQLFFFLDLQWNNRKRTKVGMQLWGKTKKAAKGRLIAEDSFVTSSRNRNVLTSNLMCIISLSDFFTSWNTAKSVSLHVWQMHASEVPAFCPTW